MDSLHERSVSLETLMPIIRERLAQGQSVRFQPKGTSMLPMLRQGRDSVTLSPLPGKLKKHDLPLYQREDGHYVLHRIVRVGETYTCMGDNQFVPEEGLDHGRMIAVVTAFSRDGKEYTAAAWQYRLYCRLWHYTRPLRRVWRYAMARIRRLLK